MCSSKTYAGSLGLAFATGALCVTSPGDAATPAIDEQLTLEEITVTARRTAENLQDVPLTVNVLSADALHDAGVTNLSQINGLAPNVVWEDLGTTLRNRISIRGISSNESNAGFEPGVGIYVDDVYLAHGLSFNSALIDVDRVEVLKGPQGTLFGRNTTAGAVSITTHRPSTDEAYVEGDVTAGNYALRQSRGVANLPLTEHSALKVSGIYRERDGYTVNTVDGSRDVNNELHYGGRAQWLLAATENLDLLASVDWYKDGGAQSVGGCFGPGVFGPICTHPDVDSLLDRTVEVNTPNDSERTMWGASLRAEWRTAGGHTLTSISAYRHLKAFVDQDQDFTKADLLRSGFALPSQWQASQELRLATRQDAALRGVVGAYYSHEFREPTVPITLQPALLAAFGINTPAQTAVAEATQKTDSYALFGQGSYDLTERVTAELGVRYTRDSKEFSYEQTVPLDLRRIPGFLVVVPFIEDDESWGAVSGTASLSFKPTESTLTYVRYSRGYKSGGYNANTTGPGQLVAIPYDPEHLDSYEIGAKFETDNRRLRANLAVFAVEYQDIQVQVQDTLRNKFVSNAGQATSRGAELEVSVVPLEGLVLQASGGVQRTEFTKFAATAVGDFTGKELTYAPRTTASLLGTYQFPLGTGWNGLISGTVIHRGDMWLDNANTVEVSSYVLVNARIGLESASGRWGVYAYSNNLTDVDRLVSVSAASLFAAGGGDANAPRTYGFEISAKL